MRTRASSASGQTLPDGLAEEDHGGGEEDGLRREDDAQARQSLAQPDGLEGHGQEQQPRPRAVGLFKAVDHIKGKDLTEGRGQPEDGGRALPVHGLPGFAGQTEHEDEQEPEQKRLNEPRTAREHKAQVLAGDEPCGLQHDASFADGAPAPGPG